MSQSGQVNRDIQRILQNLVDRLGKILTGGGDPGGGIVINADESNIALEDGGNLENLSGTVSTVGTTDVVNTTIVDGSGNPITSFGSGSVVAEYSSPVDFTSTYSDGGTIALTNLPFTPGDSSQCIYVVAADETANTSLTFQQGQNDIHLEYTAGTIVIYEAGVKITTLTANMTFNVGLNGQKKGYDEGNDLNKTQEQSPIWSRFTDAEPLVEEADIGAVDDTWIDIGSLIDVQGYKAAKIKVTYTDNDSTGGQLQILELDESGGTEFKGESATDYQKTLVADDSITYIYDLDNVTSYLQLQTKATVVGATEGTVTITVTKGY